MTILQYPVRILPNGEVSPIPDWTGGIADARIIVELPENKRADSKAPRRLEKSEQTPEEWQAACEDFIASWKGCMKGVPHMTAKEIRAERLEKKYGNNRSEE